MKERALAGRGGLLVSICFEFLTKKAEGQADTVMGVVWQHEAIVLCGAEQQLLTSRSSRQFLELSKPHLAAQGWCTPHSRA